MNARFWIVFFGALLQIAVATSRLLPVVGDWWQKQSGGPMLYPIATILSIHIALLTGTLGLLFYKEAADREKWEKGVSRALEGPKRKLLSDREFYADFQARAQRALHTVSICYFAPYPPTDIPNEERRSYYSSILSIMKSNSKVRFKRLVRDTPENRVWLTELARDLNGSWNVDLGLLKDLPKEEDDPLAMSVQIIDEEVVFLVALGGHEPDAKLRDLMLDDREAAALFAKYFRRLWKKAEIILDRGRLIERAYPTVES